MKSMSVCTTVGLGFLLFVTRVFCQKQLEYTIMEEVPTGTVLGDVALDSGLASKYESSILKSLRFSLVSNTDSSSKIFSITTIGGVLKIAKRLDRDTVCFKVTRCIVTVDVAVRPLQYFQIVQVSVNVLDVNDNRPEFPEATLRISLKENIPVGIVHVISGAIDRDSGENSVKDYALVTSASIFRLKVKRATDSDRIQILLDSPLDRETVDNYELKIIARDGGSPPKSGSVFITITVADENDNRPKFTNEIYERHIAENMTINSKVLTVKADDPDIGINGQIKYSFSRGTLARDGDTFDIDVNTGTINLKKKMNYLKKNKYTLSVLATDLGEGSFPVEAQVNIFVIEVNDHAPKIEFRNTENGRIGVLENSAPNTVVGHVSIKDLDSGENGKFTCNLSDDQFGLEHVYLNEYKVMTRTVFDREHKSKYLIIIRCKDRGKPPLSSSKQFIVNILDQNENAPKFQKSKFVGSIKENNKIGDTIMQVNCTDKDSEDNRGISYALDSHSRLLNINRKTGIITANQVFDREQLRELQTIVYAYDQGKPPLSSSAEVLIKIIDVNDESPIFSQERYVFYVLEKRPPGLEVGRVHLTDADSERFNKYTLTIEGVAEMSNAQDFFTVDDASGILKTTTLLVQEKQRIYEFIITVTEELPPWHSSVANVKVHVVDEEENLALISGTTTWVSRNMIIIFVLSGALVILFAVMVVILVICLRRKRREKDNTRRQISDNFLHVAHREMDIMKANSESGGTVKDWQMLSTLLQPPRYATVDKSEQLQIEERVPLSYPSSDQDTTEYENDSHDSVPRSVSSRKDSAPRSHKEASLPRANPPAPKPSVAPRSNPRPIQLPYMQGRPV